jgi:FlaG/FlaF family flagellin (archaellin)
VERVRLHLRLIALMIVVVGLVGGVLAVTVFDTDETSNAPTEDQAPGTTGFDSATGSTGPTLNYAQAIPLTIDGPLVGVNLTAYTRDGYSEPKVQEMIGTLAELGSTAITVVPTWYMENSTANVIAPDPEKTPSDESLAKVVSWIREDGMQAVIKPHVDVLDDSYRGEIQPTNRDQWFRSYGDFIDHFATFAASNSAGMFVAGTELKSMSTETDRWRAIVQLVRDRFFGPVTYAANWDEVDQVQFWNDLDAIGVDAYYPLSPDDGSTPTLQSLTSEWRKIAAQLEAKSRQWDRPVLLTEVGYPSQVGATAKPYEVTDQPPDQNIQALAYQATFDALSGSEWLKGISWWSWRADPGDGEKLDIDYTPEDKKAQGVLAQGQWMFEG